MHKRILYSVSVIAMSAAVPAWSQTAESQTPVQVEELIITAQKRSEKSLDVPMAITAVTGESLQSTQSFRIEDFVGKVPGLNIIGVGGFGTQLVMRGLTTGLYTVNSSTAAYVDETPYSSNGSAGLSAFIAPNLDSFDMQRIEVLKGPQGTLYGANALGGLLKYVTNAPKMSGFASGLDATLTAVDGGGRGYNLHGMVNVPVSQNSALRLVAYSNDYPGYIDDPSRKLSQINQNTVSGGRGSFLYEPNESFSIRFKAAYQKRSWDEANSVDVNPGTLSLVTGKKTFQSLVGNPGNVTNQLYNVTANWDLGFANLLSSTSRVMYRSYLGSDVSQSYGVYLSSSVFPLFGVPPYGLTIQQNSRMQATIQEVRLSSMGDGPFRWQVGGYYANQDSHVDQDTYLVDLVTKSILFKSPYPFVNTGGFYNSQTYREYAVFTNLNYKITPTIDVSVGGRYSKNTQKFRENGFGLLGGDVVLEHPSSEGVFTYSADARWFLKPDLMIYGRVATGFVPGSGNNVPILAPPTLPRSYTSSTTTNVETGIKGRLFDGRVTLEVSAFDVKWQDIQITAAFGGVSTTLNGGTARSTGVEWGIGAKPLSNLTLNFNGAYTNARLTENLPTSVNGLSGDRLPGAPLWSGSFSADYQHPITDSLGGFVGFDWRYSGKREGDFTATGPRQHLASYQMVDLRAGLSAETWKLTAFVRNLGNKLAISSVMSSTLAGEYGPQSANIYQPRTYGLTLSANF
ncbi:MAG: hypothetical protein CGW95_00590 [Phenylobacterium zucineum]|nr:MAG: hypothetical protein CGW95_00590 [Phenylobacterium zucineum]